MNIWILNHYAISPDMPGGTRHFDFGKELVKRGHNVTIYASSFHYVKREEMKLLKGERFKVEDYEGLRFVWIKTTSYYKNDWRRVLNMISYSWRVYKIARTIPQKKPDVIIGSSVHLFAVFSAFILSKSFKCRFIMEVRDLWPLTLINTGIKKWHPFVILLGILERFLYKRADKIITLLPKAYKYIKSFSIPGSKIIWIPNGVDINRFKMEKISTNKSQDFIMMYVGTFGLINDLEIVVQAASLIPSHIPIKFILVGDGPERNKLIKLAESLDLKNLEFKPPVSKSEIYKLLASADVLFAVSKNLPLYNYGLSFNKIFDYFASGKPVLFSSNSINNPVMEANAGISIVPDDPRAFAEAAIKLFNTKEEQREIMGKRGREYVEKYHSIEKLADKFLKVIS